MSRAEVYRAVDLRDRGSCRLCGAFSAQHHHHHLVYRSRGGRDATCNVILCCMSCHADIHAARVRVTGDADARDASGLLAGLTIARRPPEGWL
jgi:5-methylcytosine-specific restriction endonuclease McrA